MTFTPRRSPAEPHSGPDGDSEAMIILTQAFCPNGHNLVRRQDVLFQGYPGISLVVEGGGFKGEVVLSPIQGDPSRIGAPDSLVPGTAFKMMCPECGVELPTMAPCHCDNGGKLVALYLDKKLREDHQVGICNVFGCLRSRLLDSMELLSELIERDEP